MIFAIMTEAERVTLAVEAVEVAFVLFVFVPCVLSDFASSELVLANVSGTLLVPNTMSSRFSVYSMISTFHRSMSFYRSLLDVLLLRLHEVVHLELLHEALVAHDRHHVLHQLGLVFLVIKNLFLSKMAIN